MVFAGATKPNTTIGSVDAIDSSIHFQIPADWMTPLPSDKQDKNPYVTSGDLGGNSYAVSGDASGDYKVTNESFGVDFRGIVLAELAGDGHTHADRYVAGFSFVNPQHPDKLYVITMPILSVEAFYIDLDVMPDGTFIWDSNTPWPSDVKHLMEPDVIKILKDPSAIGRRMVITIRKALLNAQNIQVSDDMVSPGYKAFAAAVANGLSLPDGLDIRVGIANLHIPHDLDK